MNNTKTKHTIGRGRGSNPNSLLNLSPQKHETFLVKPDGIGWSVCFGPFERHDALRKAARLNVMIRDYNTHYQIASLAQARELDYVSVAELLSRRG